MNSPKVFVADFARCFHDPSFSCFDRTRTDRHGTTAYIVLVCIALHGNKIIKMFIVVLLV